MEPVLLGHEPRDYQWWPEAAEAWVAGPSGSEIGVTRYEDNLLPLRQALAVLRGCGRLASKALLTSWAAAVNGAAAYQRL